MSLRLRLSPGLGYSTYTLDQSHSSSSATSWASPVMGPYPISERTTLTITRSSGSMTTQAPISGWLDWREVGKTGSVTGAAESLAKLLTQDPEQGCVGFNLDRVRLTVDVE